MLNIQATIEGDKLVIKNLDRIIRKAPQALQRGLGLAAEETYRIAYDFLSGPGRKKVYTRKHTRKGQQYRATRISGQADSIGGRPGSYPVPVITGHLRRMLGLVEPGHSVRKNNITFRAGILEAIVFNSARYANVIHDGEFSSEKYGPRPYLTDALDKVNVVGIIEREIEKELP